ncbi:hypothetical protein LCGC14_2091700, partial [marine sediment metagenome]
MNILEPMFWHAIINITQIPKVERNLNEDIPNDSWLCNPFGDKRVYGVKFLIRDEIFSWEFFLKAETEEEAIIDGNCLLAYLMEIYPGLYGVVSTKPITIEELNKGDPIYEIVIPPPRFEEKIFLLKKIINLFNINKESIIQVYILWQKDDSLIKSIQGTELESELEADAIYKIKIFINAKSHNKLSSESTMKGVGLNYYLKYLTTNIKNAYGERAYLKHLPSDTWSKILKARPFYKNLLNKNTGRFYRRIIEDIPEEDRPCFINADIVDFNIPSNMPIEKANIIPKVNISFSIPIGEKKRQILLGNIYHNGIKTFRKAYLGLEDFVHHLFISGLSGMGKSRFLAHILEDFKIKAPEVGILTINLVKKKEDELFNADIVIKKEDSKFRVPYFIEGEDIEEICEQVAEYLIASLGLKNVVVTVMENVLSHEISNKGAPPRKIMDLFKELLDWFDKRRYHIKYQTNITRAIKNRVIKLVSSPIIDKILELGPIPQWFEEWKRGRNVFIDLSRFKKSEKRLVTHAIFQMIRTIMPEMRTNILRNVIMIDEISEILEKSQSKNSDDDKTITKYHLEIVFTAFLRAFRSRGVSLMLTDHLPSKLFEAVYKLPNIKILFRTDMGCLQLFGLNSEEQEAVFNQKRRRALVIDGVNARKFSFHTNEYLYKQSED